MKEILITLERNRMLPEKSRIKEIIKLHNELQKLYNSGLDQAIRLGELLDEQKKNLKYEEFVNWVNKNLPFSDRTARNYRVIYRNREFLKRKVLSSLDSAYLLLKKSKDKEERKEKQKEGRNKRLKELEDLSKEYDRTYQKKYEIKPRVTYSVSPAGFKLKHTLPGNIFPDMPITECIDPEYIKLKEGESNWEIRHKFEYLHYTIKDFDKAIDSFKKAYKKYGDKMFSAYTIDWTEGQEFLYLKLVKAYKRMIKKADIYLDKEIRKKR